MNTHTKENRTNVYHATKFSDILASPTFYAILIITAVLGFLSVFGILQNPTKLKSLVQGMHHKVAVTNRASVHYGYNNDALLEMNTVPQKPDASLATAASYLDKNRYSIFAEGQDKRPLSTTTFSDDDLTSISFNYDINSQQYVADIDKPVVINGF